MPTRSRLLVHVNADSDHAQAAGNGGAHDCHARLWRGEWTGWRWWAREVQAQTAPGREAVSGRQEHLEPQAERRWRDGRRSRRAHPEGRVGLPAGMRRQRPRRRYAADAGAYARHQAGGSEGRRCDHRVQHGRCRSGAGDGHHLSGRRRADSNGSSRAAASAPGCWAPGIWIWIWAAAACSDGTALLGRPQS